MENLNLSQIQNLPRYKAKTICGVYFLFQNNEIVYIGSSMNIETRLQTHKNENKKIFESYSFIEFPVEQILEKELEYFLLYKPKYNKALPNNNFLISIKAFYYQDAKKIRENLQPVFQTYYKLSDCQFLLGEDVNLKTRK